VVTSSAVLPGSRSSSSTFAVTGVPRTLLRLEGLAAVGAAAWAYQLSGGSWGWFAALLLVPDLSMVAYLAGPRAGAIAYNAVHTYVGPGLLAVLAWVTHASWFASLALIWVAHIGIDRALGYGLKYATAFSDTHLGRIGRAPNSVT
jgi:hypothetical protein